METIKTTIELEKSVREGSKRQHKIIMMSEIEPFFYNHQELFTGKTVLDLGCGEAFPRRILRRPEFKAKYKGVDTSAGCSTARYPPKPDVFADYRRDLPFEEPFDVVMALFSPNGFTDESNMGHIINFLKQGGVFIHSGSPYCYCKYREAEKISKHLKLDSIEQYITPVICGGKEIYEHNSIFSVWTKD